MGETEETTRTSLSTNNNGFDFYLKFAKPLLLNLSDPSDRVLAAAWIKKLRADEASEDLRTDYLKLLLFVLQKGKLIGPFANNPADSTLSEFPEGTKIVDIAHDLIVSEEQAQTERAKARLLGAGDHPPYAVEVSSDNLEYASSQMIPRFGVQAFYAFSSEPIHAWGNTETGLISREVLMDSAKHAVHVTPTQSLKSIKSKSLTETHKTPQKSPARSGTLGPITSTPTGEPPADVCTPSRRPVTWGSNLIEVTEPPMMDKDSALMKALGGSPRTPMRPDSPLPSPFARPSQGPTPKSPKSPSFKFDDSIAGILDFSPAQQYELDLSQTPKRSPRQSVRLSPIPGAMELSPIQSRGPRQTGYPTPPTSPDLFGIGLADVSIPEGFDDTFLSPSPRGSPQRMSPGVPSPADTSILPYGLDMSPSPKRSSRQPIHLSPIPGMDFSPIQQRIPMQSGLPTSPMFGVGLADESMPEGFDDTFTSQSPRGSPRAMSPGVPSPADMSVMGSPVRSPRKASPRQSPKSVSPLPRMSPGTPGPRGSMGPVGTPGTGGSRRLSGSPGPGGSPGQEGGTPGTDTAEIVMTISDQEAQQIIEEANASMREQDQRTAGQQDQGATAPGSPADYDPYYKHKRKDMPPTPPMFSKHKKIREGPGRNITYSPDQFGLSPDEEFQSGRDYDFRPHAIPYEKPKRLQYDPERKPMDELFPGFDFSARTDSFLDEAEPDFGEIDTFNNSLEEDLFEQLKLLQEGYALEAEVLPAAAGIATTTPSLPVTPIRRNEYGAEYPLFAEMPEFYSPERSPDTIARDQMRQLYDEGEELPPHLRSPDPFGLPLLVSQMPPEAFPMSEKKPCRQGKSKTPPRGPSPAKRPSISQSPPAPLTQTMESPGGRVQSPTKPGVLKTPKTTASEKAKTEEEVLQAAEAQYAALYDSLISPDIKAAGSPRESKDARSPPGPQTTPRPSPFRTPTRGSPQTPPFELGWKTPPSPRREKGRTPSPFKSAFGSPVAGDFLDAEQMPDIYMSPPREPTIATPPRGPEPMSYDEYIDPFASSMGRDSPQGNWLEEEEEPFADIVRAHDMQPYPKKRFDVRVGARAKPARISRRSAAPRVPPVDEEPEYYYLGSPPPSPRQPVSIDYGAPYMPPSSARQRGMGFYQSPPRAMSPQQQQRPSPRPLAPAAQGAAGIEQSIVTDTEEQIISQSQDPQQSQMVRRVVHMVQSMEGPPKTEQDIMNLANAQYAALDDTLSPQRPPPMSPKSPRPSPFRTPPRSPQSPFSPQTPPIYEPYPEDLFGVAAKVPYHAPSNLLDEEVPGFIESPMRPPVQFPGWKTPPHLRIEKKKQPSPYRPYHLGPPKPEDFLENVEAPEGFYSPPRSPETPPRGPEPMTYDEYIDPFNYAMTDEAMGIDLFAEEEPFAQKIEAHEMEPYPKKRFAVAVGASAQQVRLPRRSAPPKIPPISEEPEYLYLQSPPASPAEPVRINFGEPYMPPSSARQRASGYYESPPRPMSQFPSPQQAPRPQTGSPKRGSPRPLAPTTDAGAGAKADQSILSEAQEHFVAQFQDPEQQDLMRRVVQIVEDVEGEPPMEYGQPPSPPRAYTQESLYQSSPPREFEEIDAIDAEPMPTSPLQRPQRTPPRQSPQPQGPVVSPGIGYFDFKDPIEQFMPEFGALDLGGNETMNLMEEEAPFDMYPGSPDMYGSSPPRQQQPEQQFSPTKQISHKRVMETVVEEGEMGAPGRPGAPGSPQQGGPAICPGAQQASPGQGSGVKSPSRGASPMHKTIMSDIRRSPRGMRSTTVETTEESIMPEQITMSPSLQAQEVAAIADQQYALLADSPQTQMRRGLDRDMRELTYQQSSPVQPGPSPGPYAGTPSPKQFRSPKIEKRTLIRDEKPLIERVEEIVEEVEFPPEAEESMPAASPHKPFEWQSPPRSPTPAEVMASSEDFAYDLEAEEFPEDLYSSPGPPSPQGVCPGAGPPSPHTPPLFNQPDWNMWSTPPSGRVQTQPEYMSPDSPFGHIPGEYEDITMDGLYSSPERMSPERHEEMSPMAPGGAVCPAAMSPGTAAELAGFRMGVTSHEYTPHFMDKSRPAMKKSVRSGSRMYKLGKQRPQGLQFVPEIPEPPQSPRRPYRPPNYQVPEGRLLDMSFSPPQSPQIASRGERPVDIHAQAQQVQAAADAQYAALADSPSTQVTEVTEEMYSYGMDGNIMDQLPPLEETLNLQPAIFTQPQFDMNWQSPPRERREELPQFQPCVIPPAKPHKAPRHVTPPRFAEDMPVDYIAQEEEPELFGTPVRQADIFDEDYEGGALLSDVSPQYLYESPQQPLSPPSPAFTPSMLRGSPRTPARPSNVPSHLHRTPPSGRGMYSPPFPEAIRFEEERSAQEPMGPPPTPKRVEYVDEQVRVPRKRPRRLAFDEMPPDSPVHQPMHASPQGQFSMMQASPQEQYASMQTSPMQEPGVCPAAQFQAVSPEAHPGTPTMRRRTVTTERRVTPVRSGRSPTKQRQSPPRQSPPQAPARTPPARSPPQRSPTSDHPRSPCAAGVCSSPPSGYGEEMENMLMFGGDYTVGIHDTSDIPLDEGDTNDFDWMDM